MERPEAKKLGIIRYFTGRVCKNGHLADRYAQSGECILCLRGNRARKLKNKIGDYMERYEAMQRGDVKYYTGRACLNGHLSDRYTKSGNCASCLLENLQKAVGETNEEKAKFMENTEVIFLYVYDVDFETVKIFVSTHCQANMDSGMEKFKESFVKIKSVGAGISQCRVRVPHAIKADIYKLGEAFMSQHKATVIIPTVIASS